MYTNAVYFPSSRVYQGDTPASLNYSCINRVYYAYASIGADGSVFVSPLIIQSSLLCQLGEIALSCHN